LHVIRRLRDEMPESNTDCHRKENPQCQVAIQEGEPGARHWGTDLALGMGSRHHIGFSEDAECFSLLTYAVDFLLDGEPIESGKRQAQK